MTKVLMLCGHEPGLDPRIRWEAEGAAARFDVTVLGFNRGEAPLPERESVDGYRLIRLTQKRVSGIHYLWRLTATMPKRISIPLLIVLLVLSPLLFAGESLTRLARAAHRRASRTRVAARPEQNGISSVLNLVRGHIVLRVLHIFWLLRVQFATATSLFWNYLRQAPEKPDVVHCNDLDTLLVGVLAKRHYGCRLIFDAHEFYPRSDPDGKWLDIAFFSAVEKLLIHQADSVVTVSPLLGEAMREAYRLEHVYSVPNAEPWVDGRPLPALGAEMERLAAGRIKFLFQGRFYRGRGIEELIESWAKVDGTKAALFLRGPGNIWRERAIALAARLGLLHRSIYFPDAVSEAQLIVAAAEADVGIIPYQPLIINDRFSCPNKLSQYLHAGLLVIANDLPYVKSILTNANAGLFYTSTSPATLAVAVNKILDDPDLLRRGRENASRFARERFNWQVHGETLYALYNPTAVRETAARNRVFAPAAE